MQKEVEDEFRRRLAEAGTEALAPGVADLLDAHRPEQVALAVHAFSMSFGVGVLGERAMLALLLCSARKLEGLIEADAAAERGKLN